MRRIVGPGQHSFRRIVGVIAGILAAALIVAPAAASASAATFTVGTTNDTTPGASCSTFPAGCSLRQLIEHENALPSAPSPPDTIVVPAGTYSVSSAVVITRSVSIQGAGARTTTVEESAVDHVFFVEPPSAASVPNVTISGLTISFGVGVFGGDVLNEGILTLVEDAITGGSASSGAGVSNEGGTLTVTHTLVTGNSSTSGGADSGGIQNYGPNPVTGTAGTLEVDNSTISNNLANLGGGIFSWCNGTNGACSSSSGTNNTTIVNSTIAYNDGGTRTDQPNAGGLLASAGTITVENSIVAYNTVNNSGTASNCGSSGIASRGHNLETGIDCGFTSTGDLQSANPQFASSTPQNNGGNTNTFAVAFVSPAVDHVPATGSGCAGTDQRDVPRPQGSACDIGAFEYVQPAEGAQFSGPLVIAGCSVSSQPAPVIQWGDGTSSAPTVPPSGNAGPLTGSHTYAEEGTYTVTVGWTDDCGPHSQSFQLIVPDAALTSVGSSLTGQAGTPVSSRVATFTDADPGGTVSDYSASINWGDGSVSSGTVTSTSGGFQVAGTHTYATGAVYTTSISIFDVGGASTVAHGSATIASAPSPVITGPPAVGTTTASFSGSVNPDGLPTSAFFQYALDPKYTGGGPVVYSQSTPAQTVGSDFASHVVSTSVSGLVPNALYHVRLAATNSAGTTFGPDVTFTTGHGPAPSTPTLGKTFNVSLVSGVVLIKIHGVFVPLTELTQIPKNTVIDALHGTLSLTTAAGGTSPARDAAANGKKHKPKPKTQKGTFSGAVFKLAQATRGTGKGLVTLTLVEGAAFKGSPTYATCKKPKKKAGDASAAAVSSKVLQLLHASAKGKFKTSGRYSAATVRGTKWTIADRCDGTLTHDITDSVAVTDFVRHKTIILHAGQSYLAKAKK